MELKICTCFLIDDRTEIVEALPHRSIEIKFEAKCIVVVLPFFIKNSIEFISS
ncbi:hypothetical protein K469DRAFT_719670 [Zopfia rhizophila CBS 207.26]|uniref:Uncharacterized protein n=1 Tax=Zopfia rhizophila CBS 207.26 TaxID=1314779 RepID=A0A6A6DFI3_9PEZI|nr:hypothetical protein K469DRAFT_719670 [Zopfia rhizophila CBS 207.26]